MKKSSFIIQGSQKVKTSIGDYKSVWSDLGVVSGYLDLITGTDVNTLQKAIIEQSTHVAVLTPFPTFKITDGMRFVHDNRYYTITYADDPVGQQHHMELYLTFGGTL